MGVRNNVLWDKEFLSPGSMETEFGDYMTLPPVEERVPKHNFEAYVKEPGE